MSPSVNLSNEIFLLDMTAMTCLYDELFFHDNAEDCKWFHSGGMEVLAEETVAALCELHGVTYKPEVEVEVPKTEVDKPAAPQAGDAVKLNKGKLYSSSTGTKAYTKTGTYYLYDGQKINGRYRVTNRKSRVGKTPVGSNVSGWVVLA